MFTGKVLLAPHSSLYRKYKPGEIAPSMLQVDPPPSPPCRSNPRQRIIHRDTKPMLQFYLKVSSTSDYNENFTKKRRKSGIVYCLNRNIECKHCNQMQINFLKKKLDYNDFRPMDKPYVPTFIRSVVLKTENYCKTSGDYHIVFQHFPDLMDEACENVLKVLYHYPYEKYMEKELNQFPLNMQIMIMRHFLAAFKTKPLHLDVQSTKELVRRPLYDQFARPNKNLKTVLHKTCMLGNKASMTTIAFMCMHIMHAQENAANPMESKIKLSEIYGPLLISFAERPIICDIGFEAHRTEESVLMELVMDVCDKNIWNHVSMFQMEAAFGPMEW